MRQKMSAKVNIFEAKTNFSKLIAKVSSGEEIIISKAGNPVAKLIAIKQKTKKRIPGSAKGKIIIKKDFDSPLPKNILKGFNS